jgi:hypothetical protein
MSLQPERGLYSVYLVLIDGATPYRGKRIEKGSKALLRDVWCIR